MEFQKIDWTWSKVDQIYSREFGDFFKSHAMRVIPFELPDGNIRLYFSSRCKNDMMHPTFIDVDHKDPQKILTINEAPLLTIGKPGLFDDSGITLGSIEKVEGQYLAYYTGWKRRRYNISFELSIGVAKFNKDFSKLEKISEGPIISQSINNPYLVGGPFVKRLKDGTLNMWYCSGTEWKQAPHGPEPIYTIFKATSKDGLFWDTSNMEPQIKYNYPGEVISAPWIVQTTKGFLMYYCFRGSKNKEVKNYKIGVATSSDGENWQRFDEAVGIKTSHEGWDSKMICYPAIYQRDDKTIMFYSGNGVGKGGFGYAVASKLI